VLARADELIPVGTDESSRTPVSSPRRLPPEAQLAGKFIDRVALQHRYPPGDDAFQQGLRDLGWAKVNVTEYRFPQAPMPRAAPSYWR
jgi:hypothetical protein